MHDIHVPPNVRATYLPRTRGPALAAAVLVIIGAVAFFALFSTDADRAWQAYVSNWLFFTSVAQGAILLGVATAITKAKWNWSLRRISLSFGAFLPLSFLLLLPMLTLRENYFTWIRYIEVDEIIQAKAAYLNIPFLITRNVLGALLLFSLSLLFVYLSLRPDLGPDREADEDGDGARARWRGRLTSGWAGQAAEEDRSWSRLKVLAPALALVYALVMSVFAIDWVMTLDAHWFSTLLPGWFFMGAFWSGIVATVLVAVLLKGHGPFFDEHIGPQQLHDGGKLIFGFSIFWAYLFWSQYIVIWYGKLPWEQSWFVERAGAEWGPLSLVVLTFCFVIPFAGLIGSAPKMNPRWIGSICAIILVGFWLERFLMVAPSLHEAGTPTLTIWEPLIALGFLGLFGGSVLWFLRTFPAIQVWQPLAEPEMVEAEFPRDEVTA